MVGGVGAREDFGGIFPKAYFKMTLLAHVLVSGGTLNWKEVVAATTHAHTLFQHTTLSLMKTLFFLHYLTHTHSHTHI